MYIDIVPNRNSPPAVLLRESVREGGKVVKKTVAPSAPMNAPASPSVAKRHPPPGSDKPSSYSKPTPGHP